MMSNKGYNKTVMCKICGMFMRSDHMKRHMEAKHGTEMKNESTMATPFSDLEIELERDNEAFMKNLAIGEKISSILDDGIIHEASLSKQNKHCLELFRNQQASANVENVQLRPWQDQLIQCIEREKMNDRKIIWVIGLKGNEGKSWFQSYYQSLYGVHQVARFDITNKTADLLHIMSRSALTTINTFLFNHQRCVSSEDCCYSLLEMIKDGYASSPKFQGSILRFKTPNTVIVFSNRIPRMHSLSKDRWKIFRITNDGLIGDFEEKLWTQQKDDHSKAAKMRKDKEEKQCRGVIEIYDEHDNLVKRIRDKPS